MFCIGTAHPTSSLETIEILHLNEITEDLCGWGTKLEQNPAAILALETDLHIYNPWIFDDLICGFPPETFVAIESNELS